MLVALDRQHQGKPSAPNDRGAQFPDGSWESDHATRYGRVAQRLLQNAGVAVLWLDSGEYVDRNRQANVAAVDLYVALHVNAGATDPTRTYSLTEYSADTGQPSRSERLAGVLLNECAAELKLRAVGPHPLRAGERGHVCVGACRAPAVIFEPYFTIAAADDSLVGHSLAKGICGFLSVPLASLPDTPAPPTQFQQTHHTIEGVGPVARTIVPVRLDDHGNGYTGPDEGLNVAYDQTLAVSAHAPHSPAAGDPDYLDSRASHHEWNGKVVVQVQGGPPGATVYPILVSAD